jgi:hypothetical protein
MRLDRDGMDWIEARRDRIGSPIEMRSDEIEEALIRQITPHGSRAHCPLTR